MPPLVYGILTVALSALAFLSAFKLFHRQRRQSALFLLCLGGLILRLWTASDNYLHAWDERFHALVAKNMIEEPLKPMLYKDPVLPYDYTAWNANHVWVHKQPVPLWSMAASMALFGVNEWALRCPSVLLSCLCILLTFGVGRALFNDKVGFVAAFLCAIHGLMIELAAGRVATDHIDVFFTSFILLAVYLSINYFQTSRWLFNLLCGLSMGLAILSKWLPAMIVCPIWWLLAFHMGRRDFLRLAGSFLFMCLSALIIVLPWQMYIFSAFPLEAAWESSFNIKHITHVLEDHAHPWYYHFDRMRLHYGELIYLPLVWLIYQTFKLKNDWRYWILSIWIMVPYVFFTLVKTKMQAYTLFAGPALFIVTGLCVCLIFEGKMRLKTWMGNGLCLLLLGLPIRYAIERTKVFSHVDRQPIWTQEIKALKPMVSDYDSLVIFNSVYPIETMFYLGGSAYHHIPEVAVLDSLDRIGYTVLIREELNEHTEPKSIQLNQFGIQYRMYK